MFHFFPIIWENTRFQAVLKYKKVVLLWMDCLALAFLLKYHRIHELCLHLMIGLF